MIENCDNGNEEGENFLNERRIFLKHIDKIFALLPIGSSVQKRPLSIHLTMAHYSAVCLTRPSSASLNIIHQNMRLNTQLKSTIQTYNHLLCIRREKKRSHSDALPLMRLHYQFVNK